MVSNEVIVAELEELATFLSVNSELLDAGTFVSETGKLLGIKMQAFKTLNVAQDVDYYCALGIADNVLGLLSVYHLPLVDFNFLFSNVWGSTDYAGLGVGALAAAQRIRDWLVDEAVPVGL